MNYGRYHIKKVGRGIWWETQLKIDEKAETPLEVNLELIEKNVQHNRFA